MRSLTLMTSRMSCSIRNTVTPRSRMRSDQPDQIALLARVHAGGGLVEQQQLRIARERARDLEPALEAVGEVARVRARRRARGRRSAAVRARARATARSSRALRAACAAANRTRFACMRACSPVITLSSADMNAKSRMFWNVRAMPSAAISLGRASADRRPSNAIAPGVGCVDPGDQVEHRRLAGAVGADHRDDLARLDREREVVRPRRGRRSACVTPVELQATPSRRHRRVSSSVPRRASRIGSAARSSALRCRLGTSPSGRKSIIEHQDDAVDHEALVGEVDVASRPRARSWSPAAEMKLFERREDEAADDHARDVAHAAEHEHREHQHADVEAELIGRDELQLRRVGARPRVR